MHPPFAKLDNLTPNMMGLGTNRTAHGKLRCYGSECRGLIPIAAHIVEEVLGEVNDEVVQTVRQATLRLASLYLKTSDGAPLAEDSRRLAVLWVALERRRPNEFHIEPKLHLMQAWITHRSTKQGD